MTKKKRLFLAADRKQHVFVMTHADDDHDHDHGLRQYIVEEENGNFTILESKHHGSADGKQDQIWRNLKAHRRVISHEHILPRYLNTGMSSKNIYIGAYIELSTDIDTMPEIAHKILPFILPRKLREAVAGDLTEDFRTYVTRWGRAYALRWLSWELGLLCLRRISPATIVSAVALWFRQKLGW